MRDRSCPHDRYCSPPRRRAFRYNGFWHPLPLGVCDTPLRTPPCMYGRIAYAPCQKSFPLQSLTHARPTCHTFRGEAPDSLVRSVFRAAISPRTSPLPMFRGIILYTLTRGRGKTVRTQDSPMRFNPRAHEGRD